MLARSRVAKTYSGIGREAGRGWRARQTTHSRQDRIPACQESPAVGKMVLSVTDSSKWDQPTHALVCQSSEKKKK